MELQSHHVTRSRMDSYSWMILWCESQILVYEVTAQRCSAVVDKHFVNKTAILRKYDM